MMTANAPRAVPDSRITVLADQAVSPDRSYVLYWMTSARRTRHNFALQRAVELAASVSRPLVVLEAVRVGYPWASDRLHQFVLDGMLDNERALAAAPGHYFPYVEPTEGAGSGLVEALAREACVVVTDDYPAFFIPRMLAAVAPRLGVRLEAIDSNGLLPMRSSSQAFSTAHSFRRALQRTLPDHLDDLPRADPFEGALLPSLDSRMLRDIQRRWAPADLDAIDVGTLPLDHSVPVSPLRGGALVAGDRLSAFLDRSLARYGQERNHPDDEGQSSLSPYLHFGHIGAHEVFAAVVEREGWTLARLGTDTRGARAGWWGMSPGAESFLDELVTWRELGFNACVTDPEGYDRYESVPEWARRSLEAHANDSRKRYTLADLAAARTDDDVWNAAQRQLLIEGRIHNYLRMVWGKRILEWTDGPRDAVATMVELNNRFALDGRDANSYSGILWCLGKYDRAWGPERPIFGTVRYMSSENTKRKLRMAGYLERFGPTAVERPAEADGKAIPRH